MAHFLSPLVSVADGSSREPAGSARRFEAFLDGISGQAETEQSVALSKERERIVKEIFDIGQEEPLPPQSFKMSTLSELPSYTLIHVPSDFETPSEQQLKADLEKDDVPTKIAALKKTIQMILAGEKLPGVLMQIIRFVMPKEVISPNLTPFRCYPFVNLFCVPGPHSEEAVAHLLGDLPQDVPGRQADAGDDPGVRRLQEGPAASQRVHQGIHAQASLPRLSVESPPIEEDGNDRIALYLLSLSLLGRFLCKLKEPELLEPLMPPIRACLEHRHS